MQAERLSLGAWTARVAVALLMVTLLVALWTLRDVVLLTFLAMIVAIVLQIPVRHLEHLGLSRGLSILIATVGTIVALVIVVLLIVPVFVSQTRELADELPDFIDKAREEYDQQAIKYDWIPVIEWEEVTEGDLSDFVIDQAATLSRSVFPFLSGIGGALTSTLFMLFIAIFFITEPADYLAGLLTLFPRGYRPRALEILHQLGGMLQRWFIGQLISMTTSGIMITVLTGVVLRLPNAIALGLIAGLMEFVPNLGSLIALLPAVIIALAKDPVLVPFVIIGYLVTQQIQSNVLMPRIMSRQIALPAAIILIAQIIGATLFGFLGILLALPMAIVISVLVREIYVYDVLNARVAQLQSHTRADGTSYSAVVSEIYRPEELSPGEAAQLYSAGQNPFLRPESQVVEIVTPPSPALEQTARGQQIVWMAILVLTLAQGLALLRTLIASSDD